jgi:hypothetical protein
MVCYSKKKLQDCNSQDIYKTPNIMNKNIKEHPTGFMKWRQKLGNTICIKDMLKFTVHLANFWGLMSSVL